MLKKQPVSEKPVGTKKLAKMGGERPEPNFVRWLKKRWALELRKQLEELGRLSPKDALKLGPKFFGEKQIICTKIAAKSALDQMGVKNLQKRRAISDAAIRFFVCKNKKEQAEIEISIAQELGGEKKLVRFLLLFEENIERMASVKMTIGALPL